MIASAILATPPLRHLVMPNRQGHSGKFALCRFGWPKIPQRYALRTLELHRCFDAICSRCSPVKIIEPEDIDVQSVAIIYLVGQVLSPKAR